MVHIEIVPRAYCSNAEWNDIDWQAFEIYANISSLRKISGKGIGGNSVEDVGRYENVPCKVSAVPEIHLKDCDLSGQCVTNVINFSTRLEAFTYRYGGRAGDGGIVGWQIPKTAKALAAHGLTLKTLGLDAEAQLHGSLEHEFQEWIEEWKRRQRKQQQTETLTRQVPAAKLCYQRTVVKVPRNRKRRLQSKPTLQRTTKSFANQVPKLGRSNEKQSLLPQSDISPHRYQACSEIRRALREEFG